MIFSQKSSILKDPKGPKIDAVIPYRLILTYYKRGLRKSQQPNYSQRITPKIAGGMNGSKSGKQNGAT